MRFRPKPKLRLGLVAGAVGGLAASFLMGPVNALAEKAAPPTQKNAEDPTGKTAAAARSSA